MAIVVGNLTGTPFTDTIFDDTFAIATGTLTTLAVGTFSFGITGVTAVNGIATQVGTYGTLALNTATGAYTFTPNDAAIEALGVAPAAGLAGNGFSVFVVEAGVQQLAQVLDFAITVNPAGETLGNDTITATAINQKFAGLAGDDTYVLGAFSAGAVITEAVGGGSDTVTTGGAYTLAANVENLTLTASAVGTGNELANILTGGAFASTLIGGAGNDTLISIAGVDSLVGGAGDDSYTIDSTTDTVTELTGEGWDVVTTSVTGITLATNAEVLILGAGVLAGTGNAGANFILANTVGAATNNTLNGGTGADVMAGYDGDDTYFVDNAGDIVIENAIQGIDTVSSTISYTLSDNLENLTLTGSIAVEATGNTGNNLLTGNASNNVLNGGAGIDTMVGGAGDDAYYIHDNLDTVTELAGEGTDLIYSSAAIYTLDANVENLVVWGTAGITGIGNAANNIIYGQSLNNVLTGGDGSDILVGGRGADTINLAEATAITDTAYFAVGDSTTTGYDLVNNFAVGNAAATADNLNLDTTIIAANVIGNNGTDAGAILTNSVTSGIITFQGAALAPISAAALVLADAIAYVQANITGGQTVGFAQGADFYVFQDGGVNANDTLVDLVGLAATATSVGTAGATLGTVWII
jgi:Ca2+-binding RTX toxin-like protein